MPKQPNILAQLRGGENKKAIAALYEYYPMIRQLVCTNGGNDADAQDIFQEALLVLFRNAQKADFELTCAASTYLYSVARFMWKDSLRKKKRAVELQEDSPSIRVEFEDTLEQQEMIQQKNTTLQAIIEQLGDKCKKILTAYYYHKMSMQEIATQLNYSSTNSVKTQKYKCLERAKKMANTANKFA